MSSDSNRVDIAMNAIRDLPDDADQDTILAAVHQRLTVARDVRSAEMVVEVRENQIASTKQSWWSEWLGCLIPIVLIPALFMSMPLLFSLGERIVSRPARTTATGVIEKLEYNDGTIDTNLAGNECRVTSYHLLIEMPDNKQLVIPNEAYRKVTLNSDAE